MNALHRRQVDHDAPVDRRASRDVVAAAPHRNLQAELSRQRDGVGDVGGAAAASDQGRTLVDEAVVHTAHAVVVDVGRLKQLTTECRDYLCWWF